MRSTIAAVIAFSILTVTAPAFADTQFAVGLRVQVAKGPLNTRHAASAESPKYGTQPAGALGVLHQGPISDGGYDWWFVDYDTGPDGWSAGSFLSTSISTTSAQVAAATNSQIDALYQLVKNLQLIVAQLIAAKQSQ